MEKKIENNVGYKYSTAGQEDESGIMELLKNLGGDSSNFDLKSCVVAKDGERVIACVRVKNLDGCLELSSLAVDPEYQHRGIGSSLVTKLLEQEVKRPIFLLTSHDRESFYKKFGFNVIVPGDIADEFKGEYERIVNLPFAKNIKVIAMVIE